MTFPEFDSFFEALIDECRSMRDTKGKEYAHSASRFANFDRTSERLGISREMVANVYLDKHLDAIDSYIMHKESYSGENIQGRIVDAMVYLSLIAGMIEEHKTRLQLATPELPIEKYTYHEFRPGLVHNICNLCEQHTSDPLHH